MRNSWTIKHLKLRSSSKSYNYLRLLNRRRISPAKHLEQLASVHNSFTEVALAVILLQYRKYPLYLQRRWSINLIFYPS